MQSKPEETPTWASNIAKGVLAVFITSGGAPPPPVTPNNAITHNHIMENISSSRSSNMQQWQMTRSDRIRSLRGKYASVRTSSEEFAMRKQEEINREG